MRSGEEVQRSGSKRTQRLVIHLAMSIVLHHCSPTANAEHNEKSKTSPDLANNSYNKHLDLSNNLSHCKSEIIREPVNMSTSSITSSSDIGVAVGQDPKTEDSPHNREPEPHEPQNTPLQMQNTCSGLQWDRNSHAGELMADRQKICAVDYKLLAIPEPHTPCCRRSTTVPCSCRFTGSRCLMSWMKPWNTRSSHLSHPSCRRIHLVFIPGLFSFELGNAKRLNRIIFSLLQIWDTGSTPAHDLVAACDMRQGSGNLFFSRHSVPRFRAPGKRSCPVRVPDSCCEYYRRKVTEMISSRSGAPLIPSLGFLPGPDD